MASLHIGGIRVQVDSRGTGPDFVLVHSLLTGPEAFAIVAEALASRYRVNRVFLPGFGDSDPLPAADPSVEDLADHLAQVLEQLGCDRNSVVLGNGLGGFVVGALGVRHGSRFGPLVLSNAGAAFAPERATAFDRMSELVTEGGMGAVVDVAVRRIFPQPYLEAHPEVVDERRAVLEAVDPVAFAAACRALAVLDLRPSLGRIENRTLVVAGADDATTPPGMGEELAAGIPGAQLRVLPDCGHCPQLQQPDALVGVLDQFLAGQ